MAEKEGTLGLAIRVTIDTKAIESAVANAISPELQRALDKATRELRETSAKMAKNWLRGLPETEEPVSEKEGKVPKKKKKVTEEKGARKGEAPEVRSWFALFTKSGKFEVLFLRLLKGHGKQVMILKELLFLFGLGYLSLSVMAKYSAIWATTLKLIQLNIGFFLKPIFDILGAILMPVAIALLKLVIIPFNKWVVPFVRWLLTDPIGKKVAMILGILTSILMVLLVIKVLLGIKNLIGSLLSFFTAGGLGSAIERVVSSVVSVVTGASAGAASVAAGTAAGATAGATAGTAATGGAVGGAIGGTASAVGGGILGAVIGSYLGGSLIEWVTGNKLEGILSALEYRSRESNWLANALYSWALGLYKSSRGTWWSPFGTFAAGTVGMMTDIAERLAGAIAWLGTQFTYSPYTQSEQLAKELETAASQRNIRVDVSVDLRGSIDEIAEAVARELRDKLSDELNSRG